ncbi:MAG: CBS domain-containing protein [Clostridiales bacterium]
MNILFFLTPKTDVAYIYDDFTLRQVLEKMENSSYTAIPMISRQGEYVGTLTEGDLLWGIKNQFNLDLKKAEGVKISTIPRHMDNKPVYVTADTDDVVSKAVEQNFVPVIDDRGIFIGIITRKNIIKYFYEKFSSTAPAWLNKAE